MTKPESTRFTALSIAHKYNQYSNKYISHIDYIRSSTQSVSRSETTGHSREMAENGWPFLENIIFEISAFPSNIQGTYGTPPKNAVGFDVSAPCPVYKK